MENSVSCGQMADRNYLCASIKRMFDEHVTVRKFPNMVKEIILKAFLYNMFNGIT